LALETYKDISMQTMFDVLLLLLARNVLFLEMKVRLANVYEHYLHQIPHPLLHFIRPSLVLQALCRQSRRRHPRKVLSS
jgi:hypothetical protein